MSNLIQNIAARDAAMAKIAGSPLHSLAAKARGRLPISLAVKDTNGQIAVSMDNTNIVRFYDRTGGHGGGILVHEEYDSEPMMAWLQAQMARAQADA